MAHRRWARPIVLGLMMVLVLGLMEAANATIATASHASGWHLDSIHLAYDDEDFCVNSTGTSQPSRWADANTNAINALWGNSDPAQEWDAKAWDLGGPAWRVWFVGHADACQNLSQTERGPIEIEYWIEDDTRSGSQPYYCSGPADVSCAVADNPILYAAGH